VNATAKDVYGTSLDALWNEWTEEQQRAYRAEVTALGELSKTRLTHLGYDRKYTLLSSDGTRLAVAHEGPFERPTIRVFDEVGRDRTVATHKINNADGKSIAYSDLETYRSFAIVSDLYIWEVGGDARRITHGARLRDPSFTRDGKLIAVHNEAGRNSLVEVDSATGDMRTLYEPADDTQFSEPAVSHDGTRIAVAEWHGGQIDVVLYDRAGKRIANLTESLAHATNASPRWSRDDRTIWFSSDVTGIPNLYSVDANGGAIKRLTNVDLARARSDRARGAREGPR
jgi:Tol biopolymer transport system component